MIYKSLRIGRGSLEGYRGGSSTPIALNNTGYLHPSQKKAETLKALAVPNTMCHMRSPMKIGNRITDYSKIRKLGTLDHQVRNLF